MLLRLAILLHVKPTWRQSLIQCCYRNLARIIGMRIQVSGALDNARPLLLVTNHSSYLDIIVLGAVTKVRFAPKADVAKWPFIGAICRMTNCVFIDRRVSKTSANIGALKDALNEKSAVALFPEGTTSDGKRVLPFRSSYFALADEGAMDYPLTIQPATIRYTRIHGLPITCIERPKLAWYGDMELLPHVIELLKLSPLEVQITFHAPLISDEYNRRKNITKKAENAVYKTLHNS